MQGDLYFSTYKPDQPGSVWPQLYFHLSKKIYVSEK